MEVRLPTNLNLFFFFDMRGWPLLKCTKESLHCRPLIRWLLELFVKFILSLLNTPFALTDTNNSQNLTRASLVPICPEFYNPDITPVSIQILLPLVSLGLGHRSGTVFTRRKPTYNVCENFPVLSVSSIKFLLVLHRCVSGVTCYPTHRTNFCSRNTPKGYIIVFADSCH